MPTNLRNLQIDEGSLVDKGANQHAEIKLFKNHSDSEGREHMDDIDKAGAKLSTKSKGIIRQTIDALRGIDGLEDLEITETKKGDSMSENEDMQKRIDELQIEADKVNELTKNVEDLTKQLADNEPEDVLKGASDEVIEKMVDMQKQLDEAKADASSANEAVLAKRYEDMASELENLGEVAKTADMIRKAHDAGFGDELVEALTSASAIVKANGTIMTELGSDADTDGNADSKLDKLAKKYQEDNSVTYEAAVLAVVKSDEGRKIHSERGDI